MNFVPRWFQQEAVDAVATYIGKNPGKSPLIAAPGGAGKSGMCAMTIDRILKRGKTALYLTLTAKLIEQTLKEVLRIDPDTASRCTVACGEFGKSDFTGACVLGTAQTVIKNLDKLGGIDYVLVDEAHGIPRDPKSMYARIFAAIGDVPIIHLSGTPWRMDSGLLHEGPGATANKLVYQIRMKTLQDEGFLVKYLYRKAKIELDATNVSIKRGEFSQREMEDIALDMALCASIAKDMKLQFDAGRKHCIAFCVSIDHAEMMADALRAVGLTAEAVSSEDDKTDKRRKLRAYENGQMDVLCNFGMVTTGHDYPLTDFIAWVRATNSPGLFCQASWRGSRPVYAKGMPLDTPQQRLAAIAAGDKKDCLLRDYGGNLFRHGNLEDIEKAEARKDKLVKAKTCPNITCEAIVSRSAESCPECGEMIISHARLLQQSKKASLDFAMGAWLDVAEFWYSTFSRAKGRDGFRVSFSTPDRGEFALFILFDLDDMRGKMERRWAACGGAGPFPSSAVSAEKRARAELKKPYRIKVRRDPRDGVLRVDDVDLTGHK